MKQKRKKGGGTTLLLVLVFLAGLSLLLYPTVSNYVNSLHQSQAIMDYTQSVGQLQVEEYAVLRAQAEEYNRALLERDNQYGLTDELLEWYNALLDISGTGIMGYVEIPRINSTLPIYHGTDEAVLQVAVGHLEWTSLPVGGESTHSVISGHRGLPSAELLTHIDQMRLGDRFYVHVLDQVLEYQVDDIAVVEPQDTSRLLVAQGKDYMTLVTCTPYGVNSHRLLVRGVRVDNSGAAGTGPIYVYDEVRPISLMYVIPVVLVVVALAAGIVMWLGERHRKIYRGKRAEKTYPNSKETERVYDQDQEKTE